MGDFLFFTIIFILIMVTESIPKYHKSPRMQNSQCMETVVETRDTFLARLENVWGREMHTGSANYNKYREIPSLCRFV